jgi:hypothetical protein
MTTRRSFLRGVGGIALAASVVPFYRPAAAQGLAAPPLRFVFMPDIHLRQEYNSPQGMAASLDAVEKLEPKPAFVITGGDQCHDLRSENLERATARADLFLKIWKQHTDLPAYHLLGNHDAAGQTFICSGSVSGAQWRGPEHETPAGFAVVDCFANGTFKYRYHDYGWQAPPIPEGAR